VKSQGLEEAAQAGEEDGPFHGGQERRGIRLRILHQDLLPFQRDLHSMDAREP